MAKAKHSEISNVIYNISSESSDCVALLMCFRPQRDSCNVRQFGDSEEHYELFTSSSSQLKKNESRIITPTVWVMAEADQGNFFLLFYLEVLYTPLFFIRVISESLQVLLFIDVC